MPLTNWPTVAQAAAELGTSTKTILRKAERGLIEIRPRPVAGRKPENVVNPRDIDKLRPAPYVMTDEPQEPDTAAPAIRTNGHAGPGAELLMLFRTIATAIGTESKCVQPPRSWITLEEVAAEYPFSQVFLRRQIKAGKIDAVRGGKRGALLIRRASLEAFQG